MQGFTIIEVVIVLAVAGLILAIVLIAVPALERNAVNAARKADAGRLAAAVGEWYNDNGDMIPGNENDNDGTVQSYWVTDCQAIVQDAGPMANFGVGEGGLSSWCVADEDSATGENEFVDDYTYAGSISTSTPYQSWLVYTMDATCPSSAGPSATPQPGSSDQSVIFYPLETSNGQIIECIQAT